MCDIITEKDIDQNKLELFKKIFKKSKTVNPKITVLPILINNKVINIIQENNLIAGTKGRVAQLMIKNILKSHPNTKTLTYCGTFNGFGAVATAFGAMKEGLNSEVFLSKKATNSKERNINKKDGKYYLRQIVTLIGLGAKVHICPDFRTARQLQYQLTTKEIINKNNKNKSKKWEFINGYYNIDMGLLDKDKIMPILLSKQIKKAINSTELGKNPNPTIWLVAGTSGIAQALLLAIPNVKLKILPVGGGKYLYEAIEFMKKNPKQIEILSNELDKENLRQNREKYYKSTSGYDDRIWPYVKELGKNGDYVWNVGADDFEEF